jgi:acetoacetyl-CoA synthetase
MGGSTFEAETQINNAIEAGLSRRFLPSEICAVPEIPWTLSGKKQELPIKKLLLSHPLEKIVNEDAMANPGCLDWYLAFAGRHLLNASTRLASPKQS